MNDINQEHAQALLELKTDGRVAAAYSYGVNRLGRDTEEDSSYYLYDGRGSVAGLVASDGTLTDSYRYDPYGNLDFGTPLSINYYGYNAESTNTNTGFQYLRARYYNPQNGNFTTEDTETGTRQNPLTRNRYTYVANNPGNYQDPSGHFFKQLWNGIKSVAKKAVSVVKRVGTAIVNTVKQVGSWISNAFQNPRQTIQNVKQAAYNGYQRAASAGSNFIRSSGNAIRNPQQTFTSFKSFVAHRTSEIKATIVRELCTTANKITDTLGKVDWKTVGKIAVGGLVIAGLGIATVLTGGTAAVIAGAADGFMWGTIGGAITGGAGAATTTVASSGSSLLSNPLIKNGADNLIDTAVGAADDMAHDRDVTLGSLATDFTIGMVVDGGGTKKAAVTNSVTTSSNSTKQSTELAIYDTKFAAKQTLENGSVSENSLNALIPKDIKNNFKPSDTIEAGYKYQYDVNGSKMEVKWHSIDLKAAAKYPDSNSGNGWTAQIKVDNKLLGIDGEFYRKPSNLTHIPLTGGEK